jgi:dTMP kinase
LDDWATGGVRPHVVVLLDLSEDEAAARQAGAALDRIESEGAEFARRVRAGFRRLAQEDPSRWRVVDAGGTVDEVAARVRAAVG